MDAYTHEVYFVLPENRRRDGPNQHDRLGPFCVSGEETMVTREQMSLIVNSDTQQHFLIPHVSTEHGAVFVFGLVWHISDYVDHGPSEDYVDRALEYLRKQAVKNVYTTCYSVVDPQGRTQWINVAQAWPIPLEFFKAAGKVDWDMSHPDAPLEMLEMTRAYMEGGS